MPETVTVPSGRTTYKYDDAGRLTSFTDDTGTVSYTYDACGNVLAVKEGTSIIIREYDALNRVTSCTNAKGEIITYRYDFRGDLKELTYDNGRKITYTHNKAGKLTKVTDSRGGTTSFDYNANSQVTKIRRANGVEEARTYDSAGNLIRQVEAKGSTTLRTCEYTYDSSGNMVFKKETGGSAGTVTTAGGAESGNATDGKTAAKAGAQSQNTNAGGTGTGELTDATITASGQSITAPAGAVMTYSSDNRLLTYNGSKVEYDADGNMTYGPLDGTFTKMEYDCRNRLIKAGSTTYEYDAENNRIAKEEENSKGTVRTEYLVDTQGTLSRILTVTVTEGGKTTSTDYIHAEGLLYQETEGSRQYYHYDRQGSTVLTTDADGKEVHRFAYGTYGELLNGTEKEIRETRFLYNGKYGVETDSKSLYYMRARYYNTDIRRFINMDTVKGDMKNTQSLNRYAYVEGNPVNLFDPFGLSPMDSDGWMRLLHSVLDVAGFVPGYFGFGADMLNAVIYACEGDTANAVCSVVSAFGLPGGKLVGKLGSKFGKAGKIAGNLFRIGAGAYNAGMCISNSAGAVSAIRKEYQENGGHVTLNMVCNGLSVLSNMLGVYNSGKNAAAGVKELKSSGFGSGLKNGISGLGKKIRGLGLSRVASSKSSINSIIKNGKVSIDDLKANPSVFSRKSVDEIAQALIDAGYDVTVKESARSKSGAQIIKINNQGGGKNISQVQVSPGGGRHGSSPYVKISTTDQGVIKIIDGSESLYKTDGKENATIIFSGGN